MNNLVKFLLLAVVAFVPSEGAENRAATGLTSEVVGLLRARQGCAKHCVNTGQYCGANCDCCSGICNTGAAMPFCAS